MPELLKNYSLNLEMNLETKLTFFSYIAANFHTIYLSQKNER